MENTNNVVNNEVQDTEAKADEVQVKTFTQDEVNEMISKRLQRERKDISTNRSRKKRSRRIS